MIRIWISNEQKEIGSIDEAWINQQINRRRKEGQDVYVRVEIDHSPLRMSLCTPNTPAMGGGGRNPNAAESEVFELWEKNGLKRADFTGGHVVSFLKQLMRKL